MLRASLLASIAVVCVACKPAAPTTSLGHVGSTLPPERTSPPPAASDPAAQLGAAVLARVTLEGTLAIPGGAAYLFTYPRLEAELAARAAEGHDVQAELAAERRRCEADRAALAPEERTALDEEYLTCKALAGALLLADDQLIPECRVLGVAAFDGTGALVDTMPLGSACVGSVGSFELFDAAPREGDEILVLATFEVHGARARGGFGVVERATHLYVLSPEPAPALSQQVAIELDVTREGDACVHGIRRSARLDGSGVSEVFSQPWSACEAERCLDPDVPTDDPELADALPPCQPKPVTAERATWDPATERWGEFTAIEHDGTVLPDGIMR